MEDATSSYCVRETETGEGWIYDSEDEALDMVRQLAAEADASGMGHDTIELSKLPGGDEEENDPEWVLEGQALVAWARGGPRPDAASA